MHISYKRTKFIVQYSLLAKTSRQTASPWAMLSLGNGAAITFQVHQWIIKMALYYLHNESHLWHRNYINAPLDGIK